ncbi:DUF554 domain-containing protein [Listeria seeligeri]|uniref:DUF554 domain-containing protein n=1 Tax=Listeria seeligeri TaxID=1640 RepID=UPI001627BED4|nr:DUF554 domain-containing protein [Listeria seeligeri]MBC1527242.1 DUF554 domain-containing protein [Listeria seeligeri]MBC1942660.1 DUF554 domain-containing protein [Listeria seeligeri]MBF2460020.1 DUF554 domain-containing protein [Listeria seeligeri]MBF2550777.1 DUF554 domain-containing protein [Listeria seeligeri]MBF2564672.1 DUF554 domain-containing protein [Listeria seeligeri]
MVLLGALVNGLGILIGSIIGMKLHNIPERIKDTVMKGMGLSVIVLGIQMAFKTSNSLIVILSICFGAVIGELINIDYHLNQLGHWIERKVGANGKSNIAKGFVTSTLIFVIGAMGIIGALDSGIRGNHDVLFTKSVMDGFIALLLSTTLGWGVMFSAIPVFLFEGIIALFATQIDKFVPADLMTLIIGEITATGGIMILAIGLNLLGLTKIRVANLVPGILIAALIVAGLYYF